jgi:predicted nucleic acid-binding protein
MRSDFGVVLDACVLLPMPLADTLLRLAEKPRLYLPRWSPEIMAEVSRNLTGSFGKTPEQVSRRESAIRAAFPEAFVEDYHHLVPILKNEPKDRHVLAAAIQSKSDLIVTYNKRDFPPAILSPWGIEVQGPSTFLRSLFDLEPGIVQRKLTEQAANIDLPLVDLLLRLRTNVPAFVDFFASELGLHLPAR